MSYKDKYKKYEKKTLLLSGGGNIADIMRMSNNTKNILNIHGSVNPENISCCIESIGNGQFGFVKKGIDKNTGKTIIIKMIDLGNENFRRRLLSKDVQDEVQTQTQSLGLRDMFSSNSVKTTGEDTIDKMNKKIVQKLENEISIMKELHHENIIRYIDHTEKKKDSDGDDNNLKNKILEIYMEDICGKSLAHISKSLNGMHLNLMKKYGKQILDALQFMHSKEKNIIHMDIKGDNALLSNNSTVKIIDFGESLRVTEISGTFKLPHAGSALFIAPEIFGKNTAVDMEKEHLGKSDIWSLGVLLVELFVGNLYYPPNGDDHSEKKFEEILKILIQNLIAKINNILNDKNEDIINKFSYESTDSIGTVIDLMEKAEKNEECMDLLLLIDLIKSCLTIDYKERKSAKELLDHSFFTGNTVNYNIDSSIEIGMYFDELLKNEDILVDNTSNIVNMPSIPSIISEQGHLEYN
jgi:serine/threonine protein kinase